MLTSTERPERFFFSVGNWPNASGPPGWPGGGSGMTGLLRITTAGPAAGNPAAPEAVATGLLRVYPRRPDCG